MPERNAARCDLGDGYLLTAAGVRREKGDLTADMMLENGSILNQDRAVLNSPAGREAWATAAQDAIEIRDGPTAERLADAILNYILPDALAILQEDLKKLSQADRLVGMVGELLGDLASDVAEAVELFHDPGGIAYATSAIGDHRETWPLPSKGFRQWMARRYYEQHGKTPNSQALTDAALVLAGKAIFDGPEHQVHLRIAELEGTVYFDLCNDQWEVIAIDRDGWRVVADPPVKFRRTRGMRQLPTPVPGGSLKDLRRFLNLPEGDATGDAFWILTVSWVIAALRARGPYPILVVLGEHGSAKSTVSRVLRSLVDPNTAPIRFLPRNDRDLMIAATNGRCLVFDNLSHLQDWQSDALCRISTGGGLATRELWTDQDEMIFDVKRPIILNGIEEIVTRSDALDRSIIDYLPAIPPQRRIPEKQFRREIDQARPAILGAALDAVSMALRNEDTVSLDGYPRMADFAEWIVAAEPALPWESGDFLQAYQGNQQDANALTLEASPVAPAVRELMQDRLEPWEGTATELLAALEAITDEKIKKQKSWPASGRTLSNTLRRLAPNLRAVGIDVAFGDRKHGGKRIILITRQADRQDNPPSPSSPSSPSASSRGNSGDDETGGDATHCHQGSSSSPAESQRSAQRWENPASGDGGDAGDDEIPSFSEWAGGEEGIL